MTPLKVRWLLLSLVILLVSCEQEVIDDTINLHPFPGERPVVFAYLSNQASPITLEASRTLPFYDSRSTALLDNLTGSLIADDRPVGELIPGPEGSYEIVLSETLGTQVSYHLELMHPDFPFFRTDTVTLPQPVQWSNLQVTDLPLGVAIVGSFGTVPQGQSVSHKIIRYGEGTVIDSTEITKLPVLRADQPLMSASNQTEEVIIRPEITIFDPITRTPSDTVRIDSAHLVLYTWGKEVGKFLRSLDETNRNFGDGDESISDVTYTNVEGGFGLVTGFATDTVTFRWE